MRRIPSLDGLRALSIILVITGHWFFKQYSIDAASSFAALGVRIFFIISGYLITTLLLQEHAETGDISLQRFYIRRAYRILPAAAFLMAITFAVFWPELKWYEIGAALLYLANYLPHPPWVLAHLWSLGVEEQFYLLWPGVIKKWYRHRTTLLLSAVAIAPLYTAAGYWFRIPGIWRTFPAVADNLAVGCLIAIFFDRIPLPRRAHVVMAALVIATAPLLVPDTKWRTLAGLFLVWPLLYVSIACVVLYAVRMPPNFLNTKPIVWLGRISYSVYLWQQLFSSAPKPHAWYWMTFPIFAGAVSYYLVEQPVLRLRDSKNPPRLSPKLHIQTKPHDCCFQGSQVGN